MGTNLVPMLVLVFTIQLTLQVLEKQAEGQGE
jgi:hypothetical protein